MSDKLTVTVVWATPAVQDAVTLEVPSGSTILEVVQQSRLPATYGLDLATLAVAVLGKVRRPDAPVHDGDRLDLLRPLHADPKDARRLRARHQGSSLHARRKRAARS